MASSPAPEGPVTASLRVGAEEQYVRSRALRYIVVCTVAICLSLPGSVYLLVCGHQEFGALLAIVGGGAVYAALLLHLPDYIRARDTEWLRGLGEIRLRGSVLGWTTRYGQKGEVRLDKLAAITVERGKLVVKTKDVGFLGLARRYEICTGYFDESSIDELARETRALLKKKAK